MTFEEVKQDLWDIRDYYRLTYPFKPKTKITIPNEVERVVERYNKAAYKAPADVVALYTAMYVNGESIPHILKKWGCKRRELQQMQKKMYHYFQVHCQNARRDRNGVSGQ